MMKGKKRRERRKENVCLDLGFGSWFCSISSSFFKGSSFFVC